MIQYRSELRGLLVDRNESPSAVLRRLELINRALGQSEMASAVVGYLDIFDDGWRWLTRSNAGQPPPILIHPDGENSLLNDLGPLLGAIRRASRSNHTYLLPPGSTLRHCGTVSAA